METRAITFDEVEAFRLELMRTFGIDPDKEEGASARFVRLVPLARTYAVFDGSEMVATSACFEFEVTVPGGTLPMAGLTMVTVRPTHRRRGVLRSMMQAYLDDVAAHGEPIAGLWASETPIYGRFGFGIAAHGDNLEFDSAAMSFAWPEACDEVHMIEGDQVLEQLRPVYDRVRALRPGMLSRTEAWWRDRRIFDPRSRRQGASAKRRCVSRRDGAVTGYLEYRHRNKWDDGMPRGTVEVVELIAEDATAEASLWRFATNVDLYPKVRWWNAPTDLSLRWRTANARHLKFHRTDALWLRLCDVPRALAARWYDVEGRLRIAVHEAGETLGTYELTVESGEVGCAPSEAEPDLRLDRATLGSLYLGGVPATVLRDAGHIEGSDSAVLRAAQMFASTRAPWCPEVF